LMQHHTTAHDVAPFSVSGLGTAYPFSILSSNGQNLFQQIDQRANAIRHKLTCDTYGRLRVLPDPMLIDHPTLTQIIQTPITRTVVSQSTWDKTTINRIRRTYARHPRIHWLLSDF
ncbi:MAG: hypothetical protein CUN54_10605, partial [Phototrophicales bacterium]